MNTKNVIFGFILGVFLVSCPGYAFETKSKATDKQTTQKKVVSPRDAASGLPTGKRQHKPVSITKPIDKATPKLMQKNASGKGKAGYRLCPDGTRINPGEKCPEKSVRVGYRLCPDGTKINPGEKCPEGRKQR